MISLEHAKRSDRLMRATTSLTVREFDELAGRFGDAWAAERAAKTAAGAARQRRPGAGRKGCLVCPEQKLFFILLYFKAYPTQDVMGLLFGITQGQVSEWVRVLTIVVGQLIPLHRPTRRARDLTQLLRDQPELKEVMIDGTERRLPRPQPWPAEALLQRAQEAPCGQECDRGGPAQGAVVFADGAGQAP